MTTPQQDAAKLRPIWLKDIERAIARVPTIRQLVGSSTTTITGGGGLVAHDLGGAYHTGNLDWNRVNKAGSSLSDIATRPHSALTNLTNADDHSQYMHVQNSRNVTARHTFNPTTTNSPFIIGANASGQLVTGLNAQYVGGQLESVMMRKSANSDLDMNAFTITSDDDDLPYSLGKLVISNQSYGGFVGLRHRTLGSGTGNYMLLGSGSGQTFLNAATGQSIYFRNNNIDKMSLDTDSLDFMSAVGVGSDDYASQVSGWKITYAGAGDFRYIYTDELHAKAFIADLEQALAGGQIISKSVSILSRDFTVPAAGAAATLYVKDLPSAANMSVFQSGDIIRLRQFSRASGSLSITNAWGVATSYTDLANGEQSWTFTRSSAPNAGAMTAGAVINKDAIVLDYGTTGNGFYEVNAIDGLYAVNSPYSQIVTWTTHPSTGQTVMVRTGNLTGIGFTGEYGMYARGGAAGQYIKASGAGLLLRGADIDGYNGSTHTVHIDSGDGSMQLGVDLADLDDASLRFFGSAGDLRIGAVGVGKASLLWDESAGELSLRNNITKKIIFDNSGNSYFAGVMTIGSSGEIRQGTGTLGTNFSGFRLRNVSGIGRFSLLSGDDEDVILDDDGIDLQGDSAGGGAMSRQINWWEDLSVRTGDPMLSIQARSNGVFFSKDATIIAQGTTAYPNSFIYLQARDSTGIGGVSLALDSDGGMALSGELRLSSNAPSLGSGWAAHGGGDVTLTSYRFANLVWVTGIIDGSGTPATTIATLSAAYRPTTRQIAHAMVLTGGTTTARRVDIETDGDVTTQNWTPAAGDVVSFCIMYFIT